MGSNAAACGGGEFSLSPAVDDAGDALGPTSDVDGESAAEDGGRLPGNDAASSSSSSSSGGGALSDRRAHDDASADAPGELDAPGTSDASDDHALVEAAPCTPVAWPSASCNGMETCTGPNYCGVECTPYPGGTTCGGVCMPVPSECACAETLSCACLRVYGRCIGGGSGGAGSPLGLWAACSLDGGSVRTGSWTVPATIGAPLIVCTPDGGL